ncbi:MAG: DMT family transporter, partial [Actinomycetota bacterium]|nr:DMT family transporter [Actinomycetota bacterium]
MSSTGVAALLALAAGFGGAVQIAVQGRLGDRVGSLEAVATASLIGAVLALTVLLLARRSLAGVGEALGSPKWM